MQTIQFKVDNNYIELVLLIINNQKSNKEDDLEILNRLFEQSNNKIMVTKENAINTEEMIDDIS